MYIHNYSIYYGVHYGSGGLTTTMEQHINVSSKEYKVMFIILVFQKFAI